MAAAPMIFMIVSAVASAAAAARQGSAQKAAADYNAEVDRRNAESTNAQTTARQELQGQRAREIIGNQLAEGAESGVGLGGSRLDLLNQSLWNAEMDSLNIRYEGNLQASGLEAQANLNEMQGREAQQAGYMSAFSALAKGASSYYSAGSMGGR